MRAWDRPGHPDNVGDTVLPGRRPADDLRARLGGLSAGHPSALDYRGADEAAPRMRPLADRRLPDEMPEAAGGDQSRWDAPELAMHADRPSLADIRLTADRRTHILDGDQTGGGHRYGTGHPGKTEFPADWTDARITDAIVAVAREPEQLPVRQNWNQRWRVQGRYDDVKIAAIVEPGGRIWTAWPREGSPGVVKNEIGDR